MTTKELLTPRYEVIADYPNSDFGVECIIQLKTIHPYSGYSFILGNTVYSDSFFSKYPHLFRPLHWAEKRDVNDLPEYVFDTKYEYGVVKIISWRKSSTWFFMGEFLNNKHSQWSIPIYAINTLPSTEEEYLKQQDNGK